MLLSKIQCYAKTVKQLCRHCSSTRHPDACPLLPPSDPSPCLPSIKQELQLTHCSVIISLLFFCAQLGRGVCVLAVSMCVCVLAVGNSYSRGTIFFYLQQGVPALASRSSLASRSPQHF